MLRMVTVTFPNAGQSIGPLFYPGGEDAKFGCLDLAARYDLPEPVWHQEYRGLWLAWDEARGGTCWVMAALPGNVSEAAYHEACEAVKAHTRRTRRRKVEANAAA